MRALGVSADIARGLGQSDQKVVQPVYDIGVDALGFGFCQRIFNLAF